MPRHMQEYASDIVCTRCFQQACDEVRQRTKLDITPSCCGDGQDDGVHLLAETCPQGLHEVLATRWLLVLQRRGRLRFLAYRQSTRWLLVLLCRGHLCFLTVTPCALAGRQLGCRRKSMCPTKHLAMSRAACAPCVFQTGWEWL